jgi:hypothetical protein
MTSANENQFLEFLVKAKFLKGNILLSLLEGESEMDNTV